VCLQAIEESGSFLRPLLRQNLFPKACKAVRLSSRNALIALLLIYVAWLAAVVLGYVVGVLVLGRGSSESRHGTPLLWLSLLILIVAAAWFLSLALRLRRNTPNTMRKALITAAIILLISVLPPYSRLGLVPSILVAITAATTALLALYESRVGRSRESVAGSIASGGRSRIVRKRRHRG